MAEDHGSPYKAEYEFIDPQDGTWDGSPYKAESDSPEDQLFALYANQPKDTEGASLKLIDIMASNGVMVSGISYLTLKCDDGHFYEAKIYMPITGDCELDIFRPAKYWPWPRSVGEKGL
ncbi:hypothetical protein Dsin_009120 [Dipteronia sinensis]|uniref:Uncharacterized protein n=1 Tax=Dipteronia sinensis TaxID=43782 RepID=A0AAE0AQN7_9ROSI|nr:hypothetical protein Dsin_009120 [Dipteronia sinensis]